MRYKFWKLFLDRRYQKRDEINNAVAGMDQRSYEPRELSELFDF